MRLFESTGMTFEDKSSPKAVRPLCRLLFTRSLLAFIALIVPDLQKAAAQYGGGGGQAGKRMHVVRFGVSSLSGNYQDETKNDAQKRHEKSEAIELKGTQIRAAFAISEYDFEIESRTLNPSDTEYWSKQSALFLNFAYYYLPFPFIAPILGYYQESQTGDRNHQTAPPAFLDKSNGLTFGVRTSVVPYTYLGHGLIIQGNYYYLTSLEKSRNFGTEGQFSFGYVYDTPEYLFAVTFGRLRNFYNGSVEDDNIEDNTLHVRRIYGVDALGIYAQF